MINAERIVRELDAHLDHEVRLVIYGRASVCLGFKDLPPEAAKTQDVDAIISVARSGAFTLMKPVELVELRDAFVKVKPSALKMAQANSEA